MRPEFLALITAMAWGIGGFFEKKGLHAGNLSPQMGITIRTATALLVLAVISFPQWKTVATAGAKPLASIILGGGLVAGALGMLCFYAALKGAPLSRVMPIAFTSPLFGALMGIAFSHEPPSLRTLVGMGLSVGGIALLTLG